MFIFDHVLVQGEMKNESWLDGGKYSKKLLYENGTKKLLKIFAIACRSLTVWSLRLFIFGESFVVFWREIMDLIPFQVFFVLLIYIIFKILFIVIFFTLL